MRRLILIVASPVAAVLATAIAGVAIAAPLWYLATRHRLLYTVALVGGMAVVAARAVVAAAVRRRRGSA